jgi:hypothetical protein
VDTYIDIKTISEFLNWPKSRVQFSLERLNLINQGKIDKEAINSMPTDRMARSFVQAVTRKEINPDTKKQEVRPAISIEEQREIATDIKSDFEAKCNKPSRGLGLSKLEDLVLKKKYEATDETKKKKREEEERRQKILSFENNMASYRNIVSQLQDALRNVDRFINEFGAPHLLRSFHGNILVTDLQKLQKQIESITQKLD